MMRIVTTLVLLAGVAFADRADEVLKVWDRNEDGVLTRDELPDPGVFDRADRDGDGKITREEIKLFLGVKEPPKPKPDKPAPKKKKKKTDEKKTEARPEQRPITVRDRVKDYFRRRDLDEDGRISRKEFDGDDEGFRRFDRNRSRALSEREVRRMIEEQLEEAKRRPRPDNFFELFDRNRDGRVTKAEYDGPAEFFRRYDHDRDRVVTREELNMGPRMAGGMEPDPRYEDGPTPMPARGLLERYDEDGDGRITLEELGGAENILRRLDRNRDGVLSGPEVR